MIVLVTTSTEDRAEVFNIIQRIIQEEYAAEVNAVEVVSKALQETHRETPPKKGKKPMGFATNPEKKED